MYEKQSSADTHEKWQLFGEEQLRGLFSHWSQLEGKQNNYPAVQAAWKCIFHECRILSHECLGGKNTLINKSNFKKFSFLCFFFRVTLSVRQANMSESFLQRSPRIESGGESCRHSMCPVWMQPVLCVGLGALLRAASMWRATGLTRPSEDNTPGCSTWQPGISLEFLSSWLTR